MKKNKIFQNRIDKQIENNQKTFSVKDNNEVINNEIVLNNNLSVNEKLDKLLNRNGYIFNVVVEIVTDRKTYHTRIAGKVNNHLITLDNDIIYISDIKDIIIKS